ncbi:lipopolysaccharide biosynthesis protein [Acinetobacter silvestris]|uniref:Lipopolysaccharide biosynthesis protein n=1 Tax=Acinetobacter silvestris TaxID=1977882 RepID=A0A1Y3CL86_9GAMM|nr:lipopolysaccharide biosynthesis protein [Acinetobacter silvestris]OTG67352.1 lipopolysaccharide biosynthesis protein [Acinetobacter silvestris]
MYQFFSNKFIRNIYKFLYKTFSPKSFKHNRRYWPYYQLQRSKQGHLQQVYFQKKLVSDNMCPLPTNQKKCMLVATGPSIKELDPQLFTQLDFDYIGVNGAISLTPIKFKHYIIIDHNFIVNRFDLVLQVLNCDCTFFTTPRCLDLILRRVQISNIKCSIKVIETISHNVIDVFLGQSTTVDKHKPNYYFHHDFGFSEDIFDAVFDYYTVAYVALQVIYALNYKEIHIAGLDMNNFSQPRFYEQHHNKQATCLDLNIAAVVQAFDTAAEFFKLKQIKVYNLSKNSLIESFEKK